MEGGRATAAGGAAPCAGGSPGEYCHTMETLHPLDTPAADPIVRLRAGAWSDRYRQQGETATMRFVVTIDRDEDGVWVVECPAIPGCVSQGTTKEEAVQNAREAIALCLQVRADQGLPLTIETQQVEVSV